MLCKKAAIILFLSPTAFCEAQSVSPDDILKNNIKSVTQKSWTNGLLYSTVVFSYNDKGKIEENSFNHFNFQTGTTHYSMHRYIYKNDKLIKTLHYANEILTDSTIHHVKWEGSNWTFTDTTYQISTGKMHIRQSTRSEDSNGILYRNKTFMNDSIQDDEYSLVYFLNDSIKIKLQKSDIYYHGKKRTYENDSTIEINTPEIYRTITWEDGKFKRSLTRKFIDSMAIYEISVESDLRGRHKIKRETWYDEKGNISKVISSGRGKTKLRYTHETHIWKGTTIKETSTYNGRKIKELCRREFDQRNLPQHALYYDRHNLLTGKITWEYTYW